MIMEVKKVPAPRYCIVVGVFRRSNLSGGGYSVPGINMRLNTSMSVVRSHSPNAQDSDHAMLDYVTT